MPFEQGIGLGEEDHLVQAVSAVTPETGELSSQKGEGPLRRARNTRSPRMLALEDAQLRAEQQDFEILVMLGALGDSEKVK